MNCNILNLISLKFCKFFFSIFKILFIFAFRFTYKTKCKFTNKIEINKLKFKIMKTIIENLTLTEVIEKINIIAKSESIICNSPLIYSDWSIDWRTIEKQFKSNTKPGEWYVAIRQNGVESGESKKYVEQRCKDLGEAHIVIKFERNENDTYKMIIAR